MYILRFFCFVLFNVGCETNRTFRNKTGDYLIDKLNEYERNSKSKNMKDLYGGINEFKKCY